MDCEDISIEMPKCEETQILSRDLEDMLHFTNDIQICRTAVKIPKVSWEPKSDKGSAYITTTTMKPCRKI